MTLIQRSLLCLASLVTVALGSRCNPFSPRATLIEARATLTQALTRPAVDLEYRCPWQNEIPVEVLRPADDLFLVRLFREADCELFVGNETYRLEQFTLDLSPVHFPPIPEGLSIRINNEQVYAVEVNAQFLAVSANARQRHVTVGYFVYNHLPTDAKMTANSLIPVPPTGAVGALATFLPHRVPGFINAVVNDRHRISKTHFPGAAFQEVCGAGPRVGQTELFFFYDVPLKGSAETAVFIEEAGTLPLAPQRLQLAEASITPAARVAIRTRYTN